MTVRELLEAHKIDLNDVLDAAVGVPAPPNTPQASAHLDTTYGLEITVQIPITGK